MHKRVHVPIRNHTPVPNDRMLVIREGVHWVAMTLDHWMCAQGNTRAEAVRHLRGMATMNHAFGWAKSCNPAPTDLQVRWRSRRLWTGDGGTLERPRMVPTGTIKHKARS